MSNSVYYKATDEDGNTVIRHSWKKHKYLYIKNGKYVYPEDVQKSSVPYKGPTSAMQEQKAQKHYAFKDKQISETGTPTSWVKQGPVQQKKHVEMERRKKANLYKGPTDAIQAQKAQHEKDFQKRVRAMNAHTVAKKNADMLKKKQDRQMKQIAANVKKQNAPSTKVKKAATRDAVVKTVAARYLLDKASKSPTANAAKAKARSVVSKGEYKLERAGQKLARDVKKTGVYKKARKATSTASDRAITSAEVRNKANSVRSKAEYKIERAGQKLANDAKPYVTSAKKKINSASKNANKAYDSAKKEFNSISKDANKAYKSAKKRVKKVNKSFNKAKRAGKAYLDYLTK